MIVVAVDGRRWRLGRRRLPWWTRMLTLSDFVGGADSLAGFVFAPVLWVILAPLMYLIAWLLALAVAPFALLLRALGIARHRIVAYPLAASRRDLGHIHSLLASSGEATGLIQRTDAHLRSHARPLSLPYGEPPRRRRERPVALAALTQAPMTKRAAPDTSRPPPPAGDDPVKSS